MHFKWKILCKKICYRKTWPVWHTPSMGPKYKKIQYFSLYQGVKLYWWYMRGFVYLFIHNIISLWLQNRNSKNKTKYSPLLEINLIKPVFVSQVLKSRNLENTQFDSFSSNNPQNSQSLWPNIKKQKYTHPPKKNNYWILLLVVQVSFESNLITKNKTNTVSLYVLFAFPLCHTMLIHVQRRQ